jgi:hypothetical protein
VTANKEVGKLILESEFASVEVIYDGSSNGPRLLIRDRRSGQESYLDPLELEALVYIRHDDLSGFLDPGARQWFGSEGADEFRSPGERPTVEA